jgi:nucleotide-binding universal stress UspA family protein
MALKDILVCLDPTEAGETRLRLAAALARDHQAHLTAAFFVPQAIPGTQASDGLGVTAPTGAANVAEGSLVAGIPAPAVPPSELGRGDALAAMVEERFRAALPVRGTSDNWHIFAAGDSADLLAFARTFDLIVYGQTSPDYRLPTGFAPRDMLIACGRPLLLVPYAGNFTTVGRRVLIAWDGTREAVRAVHDALPLMQGAEAVHVILVRGDEAQFERDRPSLDRITRHLQHHGLPATAEESLRGGLPVSDVLLSRAADRNVDLIVAGAYHHSQWREALLGGVSRELLEHMTVPVLMSH